MIALAFIGMSLAWSVSWFAMKMQADSFLPPELSVFYRFFLAAILMFILCFISKQRMVLKQKEIPYFIAIGLCNFCLNFAIGYFGVKYIASGAMAVIFSLSIITSEIFSAFLDNRKIERKVLISSLVGAGGLAFFVLPLIKISQDSRIIIGIFMSLAMMMVFSFGSAVVSKNKKINQTPLYTSIAYGSLIGSFFILLFNLARGNEFNFDFSPNYIFSLLYLVVIATVLAFICLFYLIQRIGSAKANYTALVYPALALVVSSFFEDFDFNFFSLIGFLMIISALLIEFLPSKKFK
jgi:drug/metabolite transporter (DMT)-like permease